MAGQGSGHADRGAPGRSGGGRGARAQTQGGKKTEGETTGRKTAEAHATATRTRTELFDAGPANGPSSSSPCRRDPSRTRGDRRLAQTDLCTCQADQELGSQMPGEGSQKTLSQEQAVANVSSRETGSWHCCP